MHCNAEYGNAGRGAVKCRLQAENGQGGWGLTSINSPAIDIQRHSTNRNFRGRSCKPCASDGSGMRALAQSH